MVTSLALKGGSMQCHKKHWLEPDGLPYSFQTDRAG